MSGFKKIIVVCEGRSETVFVNKLMIPYFGLRKGWDCSILPITVITSSSNPTGGISKGGLSNYSKPRRDIERSLAVDTVVTTMFDFFRLPCDFPGQEEIQRGRFSIDIEKVRFLEKKMQVDILTKYSSLSESNFVPYIQLHEFEALFYSDLSILVKDSPEKKDKKSIEELMNDVMGVEPEDINNGPETAPSKRLIKAIGYQKGDAVEQPLVDIGMEKMRNRCHHFNEWISKLEELV